MAKKFVSEARKRRWKAIKAHNKQRRRMKERRRRRLVNILQKHTAGKLRQKELAAMLGVSVVTIQKDMNWLRGEISRRRQCIVCGALRPHPIPQTPGVPMNAELEPHPDSYAKQRRRRVGK